MILYLAAIAVVAAQLLAIEPTPCTAGVAIAGAMAVRRLSGGRLRTGGALAVVVLAATSAVLGEHAREPPTDAHHVTALLAGALRTPSRVTILAEVVEPGRRRAAGVRTVVEAHELLAPSRRPLPGRSNSKSWSRRRASAATGPPI